MPEINPIDEIRNDLACPKCDYNLRGLRGALVTCPECGHASDVARLIARQWKSPWWRIPGLRRVEMPAIVAVFGLLMGAFLASDRTVWDLHPVTAAMYLAVPAALWLILMVRLGYWWGSVRGVILAVQAHALIPIWIGLVPLLVIGSWQVLINLASGGLHLIWGFTALGGFVAACFAHRLGMRYLAKECLARYLSRPEPGQDRAGTLP